MDKLEFTIVIIGDDEVGKWELLETQIGSENVIRECHTASIHEGPRTDPVHIKYVNIPSAQRYIKLAPRYWTSAAAIVFVFDQNDRDSFISISTWLSAQQDFDQIQLFLIVNVHQQTVGGKQFVTENEIDQLAKQYRMRILHRNKIDRVLDEVVKVIKQVAVRTTLAGDLLGRRIGIIPGK